MLPRGIRCQVHMMKLKHVINTLLYVNIHREKYWLWILSKALWFILTTPLNLTWLTSNLALFFIVDIGD